MADTPKERFWEHRPLRVLVESQPRTRLFVRSARLACSRLMLGSDDRLSEAEVQLFPGRIDSSTLGVEEPLEPGNVLNGEYRPGFGNLIGPDQEVMIARETPAGAVLDNETDNDMAGLQILFSGYCDRPVYRQVGTPEGSSESYTLLIESPLKRLADSSWAQIFGRRMRKASAEADLAAAVAGGALPDSPHGGPSDTVITRAKPCTFNPGGQPNRARTPIRETIDGYECLVHVFADDDDPDAVPWTWAQALRYLVFFHQFDRQSASRWEDLGFVGDQNAFDETDAEIATLSGPPAPVFRIGVEDRPEAPVPAELAFAWAMCGEPRDFACDGLNVVEALILLGDRTGTHFTVRTRAKQEETTDPNTGEPQTRTLPVPVNELYWWARGAGTAKDLHREVRFEDRGMEAAELLRRCNLQQLQVEVDYSDVIPNPMVFGDIRRYEITAELVPGWRPDANLDNIDPANDAAVKAATEYADAHAELDGDNLIEDPWYRRYHKSGDQHISYAAVGRRWVLNEHGQYRPADYARTLGPFNAARYAPWEPSHPYGAGAAPLDDPTLADGIRDAVLQPDRTVAYQAVTAGSWVRVGRPFQECLTCDDEGERSLGILVDLSFDGGHRWLRLASACRTLGTEAGIQIEEPDLTLLFGPGPDFASAVDVSFWEALILGSARVRVTATIDGDTRLEPVLDAGLFGVPVATQASRLFDMSQRFKCNDREGGNSILRAGSLYGGNATTPEARVDVQSIQQFGEQLLEVCSGRQIAAAPVIPWLETQAYQVGDCIREIRGLGIRLAVHAIPQQRRYVDVVAVEFSPAKTSLILDDTRLLETLTPSGWADESMETAAPTWWTR